MRVMDILTTNGTWNLNKISFELPCSIINQIHGVYLPVTIGVKDRISWYPNPKGTLTTNFVYHFLLNNQKKPEDRGKSFSWIWSLKCPNKIKFFLWQCKHGRLPTCNYLHHIGIQIDKSCYFGNEPETIRHIFLNCPNVQKFWEAIGLGSTIRKIKNTHEPYC